MESLSGDSKSPVFVAGRRMAAGTDYKKAAQIDHRTITVWF